MRFRESRTVGDSGNLRALYEKEKRNPYFYDLEPDLMQVAVACLQDCNGDLCRWGRENLPADAWERIQGAIANLRGLVAACRGRDFDALREMFPGRHAFYEKVSSPPAFEERPMDAVVVIGISGNLIAKAQKILKRKMAREALKVQVRYPGTSSGFYPGPHSTRTTGRFFFGYYTPSIEKRMNAPRPDCDRYRNSPFHQGACRRDLTVSIVKDWLESRGHRSVRFILSSQSAWPEFSLLFHRLLPDFETVIDMNFDRRLSRGSTFIHEICGPGSLKDLWMDYEFYMRWLKEV